MNEGVEVGRIAGIRIAIHWSWIVVFVLITWTLADSVFPRQNPGLSDSAYLSMALSAAVLFFSSLLLHELGHALQARREGIEIDGITLWLFGGVARSKGMFPSAGAEFRIAIAGPLVSLAIGIVFVLGAWTLELPRAVDGVASWLGLINLILLAFNMLPALPLDGGRVLRSTLRARSGDLAAATPAASPSCSSPGGLPSLSSSDRSAASGSLSSAGSFCRRPRARRGRSRLGRRSAASASPT